MISKWFEIRCEQDDSIITLTQCNFSSCALKSFLFIKQSVAGVTKHAHFNTRLPSQSDYANHYAHLLPLIVKLLRTARKAKSAVCLIAGETPQPQIATRLESPCAMRALIKFLSPDSGSHHTFRQFTLQVARRLPSPLGMGKPFKARLPLFFFLDGILNRDRVTAGCAHISSIANQIKRFSSSWALDTLVVLEVLRTAVSARDVRRRVDKATVDRSSSVLTTALNFACRLMVRQLSARRSHCHLVARRRMTVVGYRSRTASSILEKF